MNVKKLIRNRIRRVHQQYLGRFGTARTPKRWIFVVGCYNSGTTLLHDILASHPEVAALPREGQYCTDQLLVPGEIGLARAWALQAARFRMDERAAGCADVGILKRQWSAQMRPRDREVFLEKSIPNAARIRWLARHFQDARFVAIVRNGYAVAEGIRRKACLPLEKAAQQWQVSNQIMLDDLQSTPGSMIIRYEELAQNPGKWIRELFGFLDLAAQPAPENTTEWQIHGVKSAITDMNPDSIARLNNSDRTVIEDHAGELLAELGYHLLRT